MRRKTPSLLKNLNDTLDIMTLMTHIVINLLCERYHS